ncbi:4-(cytidine 5'-diphospho)-2-C-methyl-D-erythritol kinase [Campylobacterota bacterium DY0563]
MIKQSFAKVNVFLKISGKRDNYHEIVSRFVRVPSLYDVISFDEGRFEDFTLVGNFGCETKKNTIYKAYEKLKEISPKVEEYFKKYCVIVNKSIPEFAGLGGGSSNAATFMLMINEACSLNLSKDELATIGVQIGADVPFFIYEYDSANVTGIGEIVEKFDEEVLDFEIITPKIECNTGKIFTRFRDKFYKEIDNQLKDKLLNLKSKEILSLYNIKELNDLYEAASDVYEVLKEYDKNWYFFSGSGSSFFKVKYE